MALPGNSPQLLRGLLLVAVLVACAVCAPVARAGVANAGLPGASPSNPLAGVDWGRYYVPTDNPSLDAPSAYWRRARNAADRAAFRYVLDQPRFRWFGAWIPVHDHGTKWGAYKSARRYVEMVQGCRHDAWWNQGVGLWGCHRNAGAQVGVFRLDPYEHQACRVLPTRRQVADYKAWIRQFARGLGRARVALVLQPDMPFTLCLPHHSKIDLRLISWTARVFDRLPHTTVYIDAGSSDWLRARTAANMLAAAGVRYARGFALNLTHYDSDRRQVAYGKKVVRLLARRGIRGKHFVVATGMNGKAFPFQGHASAFHVGPACPSRAARACVALGRPPTTDTGDPAVDAYLWISRPWYANARVRTYDELLRVIRASPWFP